MKTSTKLLFALVALIFTSSISTADDIGVDTITSPANGSNVYGNYPFNINFEVVNYGASAIAMGTTYDVGLLVVGSGSPSVQTFTVGASWSSGGIYTFTASNVVLPNGLPNGTYTIQIYTDLTADADSTNDTAQVVLNFISTSGIADFSKGVLGNVFYSEGLVNVNISNTMELNDFDVELYSLTGQLVGITHVSGNNLPEVSVKMAAADFSSGIYMVAIREKNILLARKKIFIE